MYRRAIEDFTVAARLRPDLAYPYRYRGFAYLSLGDTFSDLLLKAFAQGRADVLAWLTFGGLCGLRPFEDLTSIRTRWGGI
jgi:hypothetical protein